MARLGCDYETLRAVNSRLVYCSLSGWGADGPYVDRSGHDLNYVSIGGLTGAMVTPQPMGGQIADIGAAYVGVAGILAALLKRERSGEGSFVDTALSESALPFVIAPWTEAVGSGRHAPGRLTGGWACYNVYRAQDGKLVSLAALEPKFWSNFCHAVGRADLSDSDYQDPARQADLKQELVDLFATRTADDWDALLTPADCCFALVNTPGTMADDPHIQARGMLGIGTDGAPWMRSPVRLSDELFEIGRVPGYGEHTREVLREAGYSDDQIDDLVAAGAIQEQDAD
jgi:crotonobetainyl-CoA:carnitine CoA-transferase CaiB-like acyl-CoA transferase